MVLLFEQGVEVLDPQRVIVDAGAQLVGLPLDTQHIGHLAGGLLGVGQLFRPLDLDGLVPHIFDPTAAGPRCRLTEFAADQLPRRILVLVEFLRFGCRNGMRHVRNASRAIVDEDVSVFPDEGGIGAVKGLEAALAGLGEIGRRLLDLGDYVLRRRRLLGGRLRGQPSQNRGEHQRNRQMPGHHVLHFRLRWLVKCL